MKKIIYIGGISCTGKSFLLSNLNEKLRNYHISIMNFSTVLRSEFELLTHQHCFKNCEDLKKLYNAADEAVKKILNSQPIIIGGHYFFFSSQKLRISYDKPFNQISPCLAFIHLVSKIEVIKERLAHRGVKCNYDSIKIDFKYSSILSRKYSDRFHTPYYELKNNNLLDLKNNIEFIIQILKDSNTI